MFWEKFVDLCNDKNLSPNKVAENLHISSGSVTGWKNGAFPRSTTLKKIANFFEISVDYFLDVDIDEINYARKFAKKKCKNENITIQKIEKKLNTNYATFKSWCDGSSSYFNAKFDDVANLLEVSFNELVGRSERELPSEYDSFFAMQKAISQIEESEANTYTVHGSQGRGTVVKSTAKKNCSLIGNGKTYELTQTEFVALESVIKAMRNEIRD